MKKIFEEFKENLSYYELELENLVIKKETYEFILFYPGDESKKI